MLFTLNVTCVAVGQWAPQCWEQLNLLLIKGGKKSNFLDQIRFCSDLIYSKFNLLKIQSI